MRITGTLHGIDTYEKTTDITADGVGGTAVTFTRGLLITADDDTLRAASNLLCATVDIYPHPVNGLVRGECTPENYAHALARLAHAEDHLAREVRSSQALAERSQHYQGLLADTAKAMSARIAELEADRDRTIVNMQGTIDELVRQLDAAKVEASEQKVVVDSLNASLARAPDEYSRGYHAGQRNAAKHFNKP